MISLPRVSLYRWMKKSVYWGEKIVYEKRKKFIWGTGKKSRITLRLLDVEGKNPYNIVGIFDNYKKSDTFGGLPVILPDEFDEWNNAFIIVAVNNGYSEVCQKLSERGLEEGKDYLHWQELDIKFILGISALYHDSAAALICNGEIIAAAQEERFTRKKHDPSFPVHAISYCMEEAGIDYSELDAVVYYDNPILTADRLVKNLFAVGKCDIDLAHRNLKMLLTDKLWIDKTIYEFMERKLEKDKIFVCEHHISHAASAFFASPFDEAVILTFDGVGEWATSTIGIGRGNKLDIIKQINYPNSLGLLYSAFTYFCGFKVNSGEYKLMGLAPYGKPAYYDRIKEKLVTIFEDGSYKLHLEYFDYYLGGAMTNDKFAELFGGPRRECETVITQREMDLAASIQKITEEIVIKAAIYAKKITGASNLCLAGGTALNCVANGKLLEKRIFDNIWVQPAAGDGGGSIGAALYVYYHQWDRLRIVTNGDFMKGSYLGPEFVKEEILSFLEENGYKYHDYYDRCEEFYEQVAYYLAQDKIIGLFQGRMEFGPRALGNRSIIANPQSQNMQSKLNLKIKFRESFRPFAPSVLAERCEDYFDLCKESPYMLLTAPVQENLRIYPKESVQQDDHIDMLKMVNQCRSTIPAVTHLDYSARIQTVTEEKNYDYYHIIKAFEKKTGCGCIVNTSFNVRGEPIVCKPEEAYLCFMRTDMDILVLGKCILLKEEQRELNEKSDWREDYVLD